MKISRPLTDIVFFTVILAYMCSRDIKLKFAYVAKSEIVHFFLNFTRLI